MIELEYKRAVIQSLQFFDFDVQAHEDKISNFVPDLSFAVAGKDGWIEVKYQDEPPATLGGISHWTVGQEEWLYKRGMRGAAQCFLLVGTPEVHVAWKSNFLPGVRHLPWAVAIRSTPYREKSIFELVSAIHSMLTRDR